MDEQKRVEVAEPRFEHGHFLLIAGFRDRFTKETVQDISALWEKLIPHIGSIPGQKGEVTYGVCSNFDGNGGFDYMAGVEIRKLDDFPQEKYPWIEILPRQYAVFEHKGTLDQLPQTIDYIYNTWLPASDYKGLNAPELERYSADFNPKLNTGKLEICVPVEKKT